MNHLRLTPNESTVEYLKRLLVSLDSSGGYTIEKIDVQIWNTLHKGTVVVTFHESEDLVATRGKAEAERKGRG